MKRILILFAGLCLAISSCKKTISGIGEINGSVPAEVLAQLKEQGYTTTNVVATKDGYYVEGDIFISNESLKTGVKSTTLRIGETEQYRSTNVFSTLTGPRTISVSLELAFPPSLFTVYDAALTAALARYNALGLNLRFTHGTGKGGLLFVSDNNIGNNWALGPGFPDAAGNLATGPVKLNTNAIGSAPYSGFLTTLIAHEIGHSIGFRHTDYFNTMSCTQHVAESVLPWGAVLIPGTPSGLDATSWMNACLDPITNVPFNTNDRIALLNLFGCPPPAGNISGINYIINTNILSWNALAGATSYKILITAAPSQNPSKVGKTATVSTTSVELWPTLGISTVTPGTYTLTITPISSCGFGAPVSFTAFMSNPA